MANNRMWLVNDRLDERIFIGKYFPSTGWGVRPSDDGRSIENRLDEAFTKDLCSSSTGPTDWRVEYEHHDND